MRVDELAKPAGSPCVHQRLAESGASDSEIAAGGCGVHATRPPVCRGYRCLWLQGGLEDDERPDRTGGVVDLEARGIGVTLSIREIAPGRFDASPDLQRIAARYREQMPVRVMLADDEANPDRPFRVLQADGLEHRVEGESIDVFRDGVLVEQRRQPWAERWARRIGIWWRRLALAKHGTTPK